MLPSLFFSPFKTPACKMIGAVGLSLMHLGFASCLHVGLFAWEPHAIMLAFFPSEFWDWVYRKIDTPRRRAIRILVQAGAPCCRLVSAYSYFFLHPDTKVQVTGMSDAEESEALWSSHWVKVFSHQSNSGLEGFDAFVFLLDLSPVFWPFGLLCRLVTRPCWLLYTYLNVPVAYALELLLLQVKTSSLHTSRRQRILKFSFREGCALFFVIFVSWWLASHIYNVPLPNAIRILGPTLRVDQGWGMSPPLPMKSTKHTHTHTYTHTHSLTHSHIHTHTQGERDLFTIIRVLVVSPRRESIHFAA